jgi:hypothetical protein
MQPSAKRFSLSAILSLPTPGFGAYRPTTKCIAASVETCSLTL